SAAPERRKSRRNARIGRSRGPPEAAYPARRSHRRTGRSAMCPRERARGFSLYELLVTLAVAVLVLTLGLPSFGGLVADKRLRAETDALLHAIHLARKVSIARRRVVSLCPSPDGSTCVPGTDWS